MNEINKTLLSMLQISLSEYKKETGLPLTTELISERIEELTAIPRFGTADKNWLLQELEALFTIWTEPPRVLADDEGHEPWLNNKKDQIEWGFWNRYKLFLAKDAGLSPAAIDNIHDVSDEVLGQLEHPSRPGPWDRRGLVMGNVQSGKTGTYTGLICKAADCGYKVIIVLAGLHSNLRSQTQIRLDEGFLGYKPAEEHGGFVATGVSKYGAGLRADSVTNRNENGDFNLTLARQFGIQPGGNPLLFVVKKNAKILKNLHTWINSLATHEDPTTGRRFHKDVPILVIDDESDQASVDTRAGAFDEYGNIDEEHDPTAINKLIRKILYSFDKSAYVGFTATPFANIFIHDENKTNTLGEDLFPRSFIVNLPAPDNYFGAARIFGIEEDPDLGIEPSEPLGIIRIVKDHAASDDPSETIGWMPPKLINKTEHVPMFDGERKVPKSLYKAIQCFILSTLVRKWREQGPLFNSMLIHVTRLTKVQQEVRVQVQEALEEIKLRLDYGEGARSPNLLEEFKDLWENDYIISSEDVGPEYALPNWEYVKDNLRRVAGTIEIKEINGYASDVLDYEKHSKTGLNVIAVGGDKLSRGLTLEGLTVSYFLRSSRMYDTLMQMGRWFGYREKYIDLCRLFTTYELNDFFIHIANASEELRQEFNYMNTIHATPKQYGLKVRSHPVMIITSQLKMKSGTKMQLSYSGDISETVIFDRDSSVKQKNINSVKSLVSNIGLQNYTNIKNNLFWSEVNPEHIIEFLASYETHEDARRVDASLLTQYIKKRLQENELVSWSVLVASIGITAENNVSRFFNNLEVGASYRKNLEKKEPEKRYTIKRLVDPSHEYLDLDKSEAQKALDLTIEFWKDNQKKNKPPSQPKSPSGRAVRLCRAKQKGLLVIYPLIDNECTINDECYLPYVGFSISFPKTDSVKDAITYVVTNVFAKYGDLGDI